MANTVGNKAFKGTTSWSDLIRENEQLKRELVQLKHENHKLKLANVRYQVRISK